MKIDRIDIVNMVTGGCFGFTLSSLDASFGQWEFWAAIACMLIFILNNGLSSKRLNVRTGERKKWDGKRWKKKESRAIKDQQED